MSAANAIASVRATTKKVWAKKVGAANLRSAACFTSIAYASEVTLLVGQHDDGHTSRSELGKGEIPWLDPGNRDYQRRRSVSCVRVRVHCSDEGLELLVIRTMLAEQAGCEGLLND